MRQKKGAKNHIEASCGAETNTLTLHATKNRTRQYMGELRDALADGWQIVQPIFARPQWSSLDDQQKAFHFVLQRERAVRLVTIPDSNTVERFIRDRALAVNQH